MTITVEQVQEALKELTDPNTHKDYVSTKSARNVKVDGDKVSVEILLGSRLEMMTDAELGGAVEKAHIFARLPPAQKQRIIRGLEQNGHVVGFMGDGSNDSPALQDLYLAQGWILRSKRSRAVSITPRGNDAFRNLFA